jgi:hypothetical protein
VNRHNLAFAQHIVNVTRQLHFLSPRTRAMMAFAPMYRCPPSLEAFAECYREAECLCTCKVCNNKPAGPDIWVSSDDYEAWRKSCTP